MEKKNPQQNNPLSADNNSAPESAKNLLNTELENATASSQRDHANKNGISLNNIHTAPINPANSASSLKTVLNDKEAGPEKKAKDRIPAIRTYKSDVSEYTQKTKTSYFDIVSRATKRKRIHEEVESSSIFRIAALIGLGVLLLGSAGAVIYFLFLKAPAVQTQTVRAPQPIIQEDNQIIISFKTGDKKGLLDSIQNKINTPQLSGRFTYMPVLEESLDGSKTFLSMQSFLRALEIQAPAAVLNNLLPIFTTGAIDTFGQNELLIISKIKNYETVFAGMLEWEPSIITDMRLLLPRSENLNTQKLTFYDAVIKNQDVRIINNIEGQPILAYTIFNRQYLVIASSKAAMEAVLGKLITSPPII